MSGYALVLVTVRGHEQEAVHAHVTETLTSETLPLISGEYTLPALRGGGSNSLDAAKPRGACRKRSRDDEPLLAWLQLHTRLLVGCRRR